MQQYQRNVAAAYANTASTLDQQGRIAAFRNATEIMQAVADRFPERIDYTERLIRYKTLLINELTKAQRVDEAEIEFDDVMRLTETFPDRYPESVREDDLAIRSANRAELSWRMGKVSETISARQIAIHRYRLLLDQDPDNTTYKSKLCSQLKRLAYAHVSLGQFPKALARCQESISLNVQLLDEFSQDSEVSGKARATIRPIGFDPLTDRELRTRGNSTTTTTRNVSTACQRVWHVKNKMQVVAEMLVRLANVIDEADADRSDDVSIELEQACSVANRVNSKYLAVTILIGHGSFLNDRKEHELAQSKLLDALRIDRQR